MSSIGIGGANFGRQLDAPATDAVVAAAIDAGVNFFDTAEAYGADGESETLLGHALQGRRSQVVLATKFGHPMTMSMGGRAGRANVRRALENSLRRLRTDHVDLLYLHFPDPDTPVGETLSAVAELVADGKVRHAGACNVDAGQVKEAADAASSAGVAPFVAIQNLYNLLEREAGSDVLPACRSHQTGFIAFSPLAKGLLTGRYARDKAPPEGSRLALDGRAATDAEMDRVDRLADFARARGVSLLEVALGGLTAEPGVTSALVGVSSLEQLRSILAAASWSPSPADMAAMRAAAGTERPQ